MVSAISPNHGSILGGTAVNITGVHLIDAIAVRFGGTAAGFWVNDDTSITVYAPPGESNEKVDVTVTTIGGTSRAAPPTASRTHRFPRPR